jgi:Secretion system C-terminal sorting domain
MKKTKNFLPALLLLGLCYQKAKAQSSLNASGGTATGTGGSAAYSVGQLGYTVATGSGGTASAGVQQPVELFTSTHEELENIKLSLSVFPNPATSVVNLHVTELRLSDLDYQLFDLNGKQIAGQNIQSETTTIPVSNCPVGTYFLKVNQGNNEIKSFKILINQ